MKRTITLAISLGFTLIGLAESIPQGAKAIFIDSTSGSRVESAASPAPRQAKSKPAMRKRNVVPVVSTVTPVEVSGLMYYVELVSAKGETSRVTTDHMFRSGDRMLLHVVSSIDGDLAIYQRTPASQAARLFPDSRINDGSARIVKGVDAILPSPTSWFRFDNQAGTEELTLVLTPRAASAPVPAMQTAAARYEDVGSAAGSKGLVVETDNSGTAQATYVVRRTEAGRPPEPVVVRIQLEHR